MRKGKAKKSITSFHSKMHQLCSFIWNQEQIMKRHENKIKKNLLEWLLNEVKITTLISKPQKKSRRLISQVLH